MISNQFFTTVPLIVEIEVKSIPLYTRLSQHSII